MQARQHQSLRLRMYLMVKRSLTHGSIWSWCLDDLELSTLGFL